MLPRVFPEGTSREGGTRLREAPGLDAALHRARHMAPKASSTRDSTQWDVWRGGATICGELLEFDRGKFVEMRNLTPFRLAAHVTARSGMGKGCGATIFRDGVLLKGESLPLFGYLVMISPSDRRMIFLDKSTSFE